MLLNPSANFGAFLVTNGGSSRFGAAVSNAIRERVSGVPTAPAPPPARSAAPAVDPTGAYRSTRYAHHGVENLPALFNGQLHVSRVSADTIDVQGIGDASGHYVATDSTHWVSTNRSDAVAARTRDGRVTHFFASQSFFGTRFPSAYERLAWYDEPHFLNEALSWVMAVPLLALLAWPVVAGVVWLIRRRTRLVVRIRPSLGAGWRRTAVAAAVAFVGLGMWFGFGFIAVTNRAAERGGGEIVYGMPPVMRILAWAPPVIGVLACVLVVATVIGWRRRWWSIPGLLLFTTIAVNAVLFTAMLVRWGYFPELG